MIQLSHIGEVLIATMLMESDTASKLVLGELFNQDSSYEYVPEIRLNQCGPLIFDGVHKIDVSVLDKSKSICTPIEAKLGLDRLSKNEFGKRFLGGCGKSHNDSRVTGSMISVLERKLPKECIDNELAISYLGNNYSVNSSWILICRQKIIDAWQRNGQPALSSRCKVVAFESLVAAIGGRQTFNSLIANLLKADYYQDWLKNA